MFPRTAVLVPAYKRPEYTKICIDAIEKAQPYENTDFYLVDDGSQDGTLEIFLESRLPKIVIQHNENLGLRNTIIEFFEITASKGYQYLTKMDNDCEVPLNWLSSLIHVLETTDADVISPNVIPSNAAYTHGREDLEGKGYRPSDIVGGLWCMKASLPQDVFFERTAPSGIVGSFNILKQILTEKEPKVGWVSSVTVQDIGHWSGKHPSHIKSKEHELYSLEVGRSIAWA